MQDNSGVTLEAVAMVRGAGGAMVNVTAGAKEQTESELCLNAPKPFVTTYIEQREYTGRARSGKISVSIKHTCKQADYLSPHTGP